MELLLNWEDSQSTTAPKTAERICAARPDLIVELKRRILALARIDRLLFAPAITQDLHSSFEGSLVASPFPNLPGYRVVAEIGRGGMGLVFKAVQLRLNRLVAIKLIRSGKWASPQIVARFKIEAEILAKVQNRGIVQIHDILESDGVLCLILEFVDGKSLAETTRKSTTAPLEAAKIVREIAAIIATVHEKGILHRDIKPGNILIDAAGCVKVTDFGLAKELFVDSNQTATGDVFGSPSYMAPEQALGDPAKISARTDVYAIGATLYELLTARPPFAGSSVMDTLIQVKTQEPTSPRIIVKSVPGDLETICLKCLEKQSERRYASAAALGEDLDRYLRGIPIKARAVTPMERGFRWCHRNPGTALLSLLTLLSVIAFTAGMTRLVSRLNSANEQARLQDLALKSEESRSATREFYARYGYIRERGLNRPLGWLQTNLDEIKDAAKLTETQDGHQLLRSESLRCFCSFDARVIRSLVTGVDINRMAHHPARPILAMGDNVSENSLSVSVRLLDTNTYEELKPLAFTVSASVGNQKVDGCRSLTFTSTGDKLLVGSRRGWIYVWDTSTWNMTDSWQAHADWVIGIAIDPESNAIYSASSDGELKQWDLVTHTPLRQSKVDREVYGLCLTRKHLIVAADAGCVLSLSDFRSVAQSQNWLKNLTSIAPTFDGKGVYIAHRERLKQMEVAHEREGREFTDPRLRRAHQESIRSLVASRCGRFAVSADISSVKLWDTIGGTLISSVNVGNEGGKAVEFLPDGNRFAIAGRDEVRLYEIQQHPSWTAKPLNAEPLFDATLAQRQPVLAQLGTSFSEESVWRGDIQTQDLATGQNHRGVTFDTDRTMVFSDTAGIAITNPGNSSISLIDRETFSPIRNIPCGPDAKDFVLDQTGMRLYYVADELTTTGTRKPPSCVFVADLLAGTTTLLWSNSESAIRLNRSQILAIAIDQKWLISSSRDGNVRIHESKDGTVLSAIRVTSDVTSLQMAGDSLVLTGDDRGTIRVMRLPDGTIQDERSEHLDEISGFALDDRNGIVVSSCRGGLLRFWKWDGQRKTLQLHGTAGPFSGPIRRVKISDDGQMLMILVEGETAARIMHLRHIRKGLHQLGLTW